MLLLLYSYSGYCIAFDTHSTFSLPDGTGFGKNAIIVGSKAKAYNNSVLFVNLIRIYQFKAK